MQFKRCCLLVAAVILALPNAGAGQRLADWPVRSSALPDAVVTGVSAIFWNPAGVSTGDYRAQAIVLNLNAPETLDLRGLAAGTAIQFEKTVLALGYEHVGVSDFTRTDDSPGGETAAKFDLGEDHLTLAAAHQLSTAFSVGATARYARDDLDETDAVVGVGAGFRGTFAMPWQMTIGAFALSEHDHVGWAAGTELTLPGWLGPDYRVAVAYGLQDDARMAGWRHRLTTQFQWKEHAIVAAGVNRESDLAGDHWTPILAASLHLHRYGLGVVREKLANDFGATYSFHLQIGLGK
jgi:hypothetical protein